MLNSTEHFRGRIFTVTVDTIREGDKVYEREVVHHPGSAVIVPVFDDGTIALVRQYRHPAGRYLLEAPAGTLRRGEDPGSRRKSRIGGGTRLRIRASGEVNRIFCFAGILRREDVGLPGDGIDRDRAATR